MNRYESYKPSDIDWVGEIPSHWDTVQPKYKLNRVTRPIDDEDEVITCFRDGVVTLRKNRREDGFTNSVKEHGYQQIHPGDLVVHEMDGFAGAIGISDSKGKSTPVYTVVEPDDRTDLKYIAYLLREMSQTGKIESLARSIRERTTDFRWNMWSVINFPFPPIEEQKLISRYLDKKTSQIDSLVEKIQKKIEILKEQRTSLINQYVTKGLDPNVEMKYSGVEWIGEIPKHWELQKGKYILKILSTGVVGDETDGEGIPLIKVDDLNEVSDGYFLTKSKSKVNPDISSKLLPKGILIFPKRGMTIFTNKIAISDINGLLDPNLMGIQVGQTVLSKFLFHLIQNRGLGDICDQTTVPQINNKHIYPLEFQVPPLEEQHEIVDHIDTKSQNLTSIINGENVRIDLLKEYRQSLISSVVTGKVRVTEDMI